MLIHHSPTRSLVCDTEFLHFEQLDLIHEVKDGKEVIHVHMELNISL